MQIQYVRDKENRRIGVVVEDDNGGMGYALSGEAPLTHKTRAKAKEIAVNRAWTGKDYKSSLKARIAKLSDLGLPNWKLQAVVNIMDRMERRTRDLDDEVAYEEAESI